VSPAREEIIVEMLKRYTEAQETGSEGIRGDGGGAIQMPPTWNRSYRELERCLGLLRDERKSQYWHVCERYIRPEILTMTVPSRKGKPKLPPHTELVAGAASSKDKTMRVRVRRWSEKVKLQKVDRGVARLSETFKGEPYMPDEFRDLNERKAA
jgi:hypothetical protein